MCFRDDDDDDDDDGEASSGRIVTVRPGRRLFVRRIVFGSGDELTSEAATAAPTLVFVHGSCATERQYHRLVKAMQDQIDTPFPPGTTCILFDLAGCGQSPAPTRPAGTGEDAGDGAGDGRVKSLARRCRSWIAAQDSDLYDNDESIQDLRAVIAANCAPASPLFLVGHSYAANLILPYVLLEQSVSTIKDEALAREKAAVIKGVILLSCGIRTPSNPLPDGGSPLIRNLPLPLLNCIQSSLTSGFVNAAIHPDNARQNPDIVEELIESCTANRMEVVQAYHSQVKWFSLPGSQPLLPFSFLIVHGDQDKIIPIQAGQEISNQLRHELHVVPNAGHMITMERPQEIASLVRNFVESHR
jgi:pimeloyl-ACP methyl ester carboxylesterase